MSFLFLITVRECAKKLSCHDEFCDLIRIPPCLEYCQVWSIAVVEQSRTIRRAYIPGDESGAKKGPPWKIEKEKEDSGGRSSSIECLGGLHRPTRLWPPLPVCPPPKVQHETDQVMGSNARSFLTQGPTPLLGGLGRDGSTSEGNTHTRISRVKVGSPEKKK